MMNRLMMILMNYTVRSCYKLQHATFTDEYISSHFISYVSLSTLIPRPPSFPGHAPPLHELEVEKAWEQNYPQSPPTSPSLPLSLLPHTHIHTPPHTHTHTHAHTHTYYSKYWFSCTLYYLQTFPVTANNQILEIGKA